MKPFISFIVPAYNAGETISLCLKSITEQDYPSDRMEVIVVDNNSNDNTASLAHAYNLIREANQGRSHARNAGAKIAKGEFLAFIDADVILDKSWLVESLKSFSYPSVGAVQGQIIPSDKDEKKSLNKYRYRAVQEATNGTFNLLRLTVKESPMINTAACLYRKSAFEKAGGFDPELKRHEDIDLSKRVLLSGYDLGVSLDSKASVLFNGTGWNSYFMRSFEDGFYKGDYLAKWENWLFLTGTSMKETNLLMFLSEVPANIFRSLLKRDFYYSLKAINSFMKTLGRVLKSLKGTKLKAYDAKPEKEKAFIYIGSMPLIEFNMMKKTVGKVKGAE